MQKKKNFLQLINISSDRPRTFFDLSISHVQKEAVKNSEKASASELVLLLLLSEVLFLGVVSFGFVFFFLMKRKKIDCLE